MPGSGKVCRAPALFVEVHFSIFIGQLHTIMATPAADSDPTQQREPTITNAPPPGRKFPCGKCGAKLDFDPSSRALQCPYCGYTQVIEPSSKDVEEHDLEAQLRQGVSGGVLAGRSSQVRC